MIARLPTEEPQEHLAFLEWLAHTPPRPAPNPSLAPAHNWTERANAFDALCAPDADPLAQLKLAARTEVRRLLARVLGGSPMAPTLTLKELATLLEIVAALPKLEPERAAGAANALDVTGLSTEELNVLAKVAVKAEQQQELE